MARSAPRAAEDVNWACANWLERVDLGDVARIRGLSRLTEGRGGAVCCQDCSARGRAQAKWGMSGQASARRCSRRAPAQRARTPAPGAPATAGA